MDKEAQEKTTNTIYDHREALYRRGLLSCEELASIILKELVELGYRKLPKDKPPLIDNPWQGDIDIFNNIRLATKQGFDEGKRAQREADIKHYEQ